MEYDEIVIHGHKNKSNYFQIRVSQDDLIPEGGAIKDTPISPQDVAEIREIYDEGVKQARQYREGYPSRAALRNQRLMGVVGQLRECLAEEREVDLPAIRDLCQSFLAKWQGGSPVEAPTKYKEMLEIGGKMRNIFPGRALRVLQRSLVRVKTARPACGLRVIIDVDANAQMLLDLPWEMLVIDDEATKAQDFLFLQPNVVVMRQIRNIGVAQSVEITQPLATQVFVTQPVKATPIDAQIFEHELKPIYQDAPLDAWWSTGPDMLEVMRERVAMHNPQIVQIVCHGHLAPVSQSDVRRADMLLTHVDEGKTYMHRVSPYDLLPVLNAGDRLQVVLLTVCDSGRAEQGQAEAEAEQPPTAIVSNIAYELVRGGIPIVIAMQDKITQSAAARFSRVFYENLQAGRSIEDALARARSALHTYRWGMDWTMPVVYRGAHQTAHTAWHVSVADWLETMIYAPRRRRDLRSTTIALSAALTIGSIARWIFWPSDLGIDPRMLQDAMLCWGMMGAFAPPLSVLLYHPERRQIDDPSERTAVLWSHIVGAALGYVLGGFGIALVVPLVYLLGEWVPSMVWWIVLLGVIGFSLLISIVAARSQARGVPGNFRLYPELAGPQFGLGVGLILMLGFFVLVPAALTFDPVRMIIEPLGPSSLGMLIALLMVVMVVSVDNE